MIVIFDVPEVEKRKRGWLRESLSILGFSQLQKRVYASICKHEDNHPHKNIVFISHGGALKMLFQKLLIIRAKMMMK